MKLPFAVDKEVQPAVTIFVASGILLAIYMNHGTSGFAASTLGVRATAPGAVLWQYLAAFFLFFAAPVALWRFLIRRPPSEIGLRLGDWRFGVRFLLVAIPLLVIPLTWAGTKMPDVRAAYPLTRTAAGAPLFVPWLEAAYILYYLGWEFFFRGWMTLGLADRLGEVGAVGTSMLVSTAIHMGKPSGEIWGAVIVGVVFGWLAIRTRSIVWPLILHISVGILTDVFIIWTSGAGW